MTHRPQHLACRAARIVDIARAFVANPNDDEKRLAYLKATFNLDDTAAVIPACVAWVRTTKEDAHKRTCAAIRERQAAESRATAAEARVAELEGEVADLKSDLMAFCGVWAVPYAKDRGLPEGHLTPQHYDILERCGARMDDFTRATLTEKTDDA